MTNIQFQELHQKLNIKTHINQKLKLEIYLKISSKSENWSNYEIPLEILLNFASWISLIAQVLIEKSPLEVHAKMEKYSKCSSLKDDHKIALRDRGEP